jgi:omega-6 fatty acid desaturase (delta-12 desaturase)
MEGNDLVASTRRFASEDLGRSYFHVVTTLGLIAAAAGIAAAAPWWPLRIAASVVEGLLIVRGFILAHDYQHGAILRRSAIGKAIFTLYGLLVLTPPRAWRQTHNYHHANTAKIVGAQIGSFPVMTVEMWRRAPRSKRIAYAAARHPITILFGYVTIFLTGMCLASFLRKPRENWDGAVALVLHGALVAGLTYFFGADVAILSLVLPLMIACAVGGYLFYAQHNFPDIHIQPRQTWTFARAALESSSYMRMGPVMSFFTGRSPHHVPPERPSRSTAARAMAAIPSWNRSRTSLPRATIAPPACLGTRRRSGWWGSRRRPEAAAA